MNIAIIPARGGSKRIPRKNIKEFNGRPMIAWSIEAAQKSGCFEKVIVSTDDEAIAEISQRWGAETPFVRPAELADDYTTTTEVAGHAITWCQENQIPIKNACCIYATAPFLQADDLKKGLETLLNHQCDYVFPVTRFSFPIQRAIRINTFGYVEMFQPEHFLSRSQDLEEAWHDAGQFYWGKLDAWLENKPIFANSMPVTIPNYRVQDIDTLEDWERAELLFKMIRRDV